ncbi:MAG: hypothetical protein D6689_18985 [Deltaproteobacteria bacterium]|nr:MAG: hypothetical protein D6689_18985 [Deltaproteobacteria bacterium]
MDRGAPRPRASTGPPPPRGRHQRPRRATPSGPPTQPRPKDADRLLAPLLAELASLGYRLGSDLADDIAKSLSLPGSTGADDVARAIRAVDEGWGRWLDGQFQAAIDTLSGAVAVLHANPEAFAANPAHRRLLQRALVGLALAHKRLGQADASEAAMAELVRSFPDEELDRAEYGPEAYGLYRRVQSAVREQRPGSLRISVDDDSAAVFVNERFAGTGEVFLTDLPPGTYRVHVRRGKSGGRLHLVDVASGVNRVLSVDTALDAALRTRGGVVSLEFDRPGERARLEAGKATAIAREVGASGVIVIGVRPFEGRRSIVGSLLSLDSGKPQRSAAIAVEPTLPADALTRSLARFLAGEEPAPGLIIAEPRPGERGGRPRRRFGPWPWVSAGAGLVAIGAGAFLIDLDGPIFDDQGRHTPEEYRTRGAGIGLAVGGGIALATGVALWWLDRRTEPAVVPAVEVAGERFGVGIMGRF